MIRIAASALALLLLAPAAQAQNVVMFNGSNRPAPSSGKPQTVSITFQLTLPAPDTSASAEMTKAMAATSQSLYDIINRECDVLNAVLKGDCKLSHLNIGGNFNENGYTPVPFGARPNNGPVVNATATATFEIGAKPPSPASPQQ